MEARELSKTFDELESDDLSLETSVPTDLTLSPDRCDSDGGGLREGRGHRARVTKQLIERKQLLHDLQLLKIELSQKTLMISNMKAESLQKVEELDEKLHDAVHQKQILQARLETQLQVQQDDAKKRQELIKTELSEVMRKQQQLESTNERLREKAGDVKRTLKDLDLSEERYYELRTESEDDLSLRDFVSIKLFEAVKPLETEIEHLRMRNRSLEAELKCYSKSSTENQEKLDDEREEHADLRVKYQKTSMELAETKSQLKFDDYKVENYDRVKSERDNLEQNYLDLQRQFTVLEGSQQNIQKERDDLHRELSTAKQSLALIKQDKEYLSRQITDLTNKCSFAEEKNQQLGRQLEDAKLAREEMYEKYVSSRDQYKTDYENKLREELDQIRIRTNSEIDRLRSSTKEMYERENRNLREARDMAISEKERAQATERETNTKYEQLMNEYRQIQIHGDNKVAEQKNELKIKAFEMERTQMVYEESVKNLKESQLDGEKLQKKAEVLTKEYFTLQMEMEKRISELETQLSEKCVKLEAYEKVEKELDDVVMQAAEIEDEQEAEKVLFSYGYGASVPSTAKRRLQQSVHLARRVLQLERANTSLQKEINREKVRTKEIAEELKNNNQILDQAQQPYNYLIDNIRSKDSSVQKYKEQIAMMEKDLHHLSKENEELTRSRNQMSLDLERLLNQKEEMSVMKQVVLNLSTRKLGDSKRSRSPPKPKTAAFQSHNMFDSDDDPNIVKPGYMSLTNKGSPKWYKKLKQKNADLAKFSVYGKATA